MTHSTNSLPRTPKLRSDNPEMIPLPLLRGMLALALATVALVAFAALTGREPVGVPQPSAIVTERPIVLQGHSAQAVTVLNVDGTVLVDLPHGGFVTVIQSSLATERRKHGVDPLLPVRLVKYENGRLTIEDDHTGWSAELYAFGADNKAAFERLLSR
jgi:putative photosynthetic complex assembly protein